MTGYFVIKPFCHYGPYSLLVAVVTLSPSVQSLSASVPEAPLSPADVPAPPSSLTAPPAPPPPSVAPGATQDAALTQSVSALAMAPIRTPPQAIDLISVSTSSTRAKTPASGQRKRRLDPILRLAAALDGKYWNASSSPSAAPAEADAAINATAMVSTPSADSVVSSPAKSPRRSRTVENGNLIDVVSISDDESSVQVTVRQRRNAGEQDSDMEVTVRVTKKNRAGQQAPPPAAAAAPPAAVTAPETSGDAKVCRLCFALLSQRQLRCVIFGNVIFF